MTKNILMLVMIAGLLSKAWAQDTLQISLETLQTKVQERNLQARIAEKQLESASADFRQSNALFLPSISASHTAIVTTNPLMAFGSKLNQELLTPADFDPNLLNNPGKTENYATQIEVLQPLINVDGIYQRQAARSKMEAYGLQAERTKEYLELEVSKAYMQLQLAYKAVEVMQQANTTAQANLKLVNDFYDQGMLQKTDLLDVQVRVGEVSNHLQAARSNVQNASDYLAFLMNEPTNVQVYIPAEPLSGEVEMEVFDISLSENRKDIQAVNKTSEAYEKMLQSGKMTFLPRLNAFGNYQMYDDKLFGTRAKGYLVGAQLSWTLFDGYKSIGKLQKNKVEYQKAEAEADQYKSKSQMELNAAYRQLKDAQNKSNNAGLALEQSKEAYKIRKDRFEEGLVKTSDLLMSETQMYQKELEFLQTVFEYNFTKNYLEFLTK
ncbi:MAG: TolC family protein [Cyclobacteriaceae bacterium]